MSYVETHDVVGMTCDHCVRAVRAEVSAIEGVTDVDVDLIRGVVHVTAEQPVSTTALREAVINHNTTRSRRSAALSSVRPTARRCARRR